jgi:DNA-binding FadR family transcriptional regulator
VAAGAEGGRNLTFALAERLGGDIVAGRFAGRAFPTEAELAKLHGVSRSVVREAVKMLTAKGLLGAWPRRGTRILPPEEWNLLDPDILKWVSQQDGCGELLRQLREFLTAILPCAAAWKAACAEQSPSPELAADLLRATANPFFVRLAAIVPGVLGSRAP